MPDLNQLLFDRTQAAEVRIDAARKLSRELQHWELGKLLSPIIDSEEEDPAVRIAFLALLAHQNPAASVQLLTRPFEDESVRRSAIQILDSLPPLSGDQDILLDAELSYLRGSLTEIDIQSLPLDKTSKGILLAKVRSRDPEVGRSCDAVNLPRRWGRDPRVIAFLNEEINRPLDHRRRDAVYGLCTLGELASALAAADDASPVVRSTLARMLGYYRERQCADVLQRLLRDNDPEVSKEAKTALRLLNQLEMPVGSEQAARVSPMGRLLAEISRIQLTDRTIAAEKPDHKIQMTWLGERGATETEIASAEQRLGVRLPPSYRAFLAETNGFADIGPFIYRMYSTSEIDWFRVRNQDWIDAYQTGEDVSPEEHLANPNDCVRFRAAYLSSCLQISEEGDSAVVLLNPEIVNSEGEWETWFFANWNPGAERYPSFRAYVESELESIKRLRAAKP